ncbi:aspartate aminotransferase family protein [Herbidospora mongoliensis]|uniref:aspartate aminotransferase family protein n=1 Tax=Herbidospora mongoliensis TaxID=688067 RepID=UPI00082BD7C8|nr:aminotransferase class III-fold pyridoxal phosphate-dependent enzyme [Herbidospora mongoliensis]
MRVDAEHDLAEPHLRQVLMSAGLDVEYVRAEGDILYQRSADGTERPVLDLVGGYGSLLFGHNHPEIVAHAKALLDARTPVLAQFSVQSVASEVAAALNRIMRRELGTDEPFFAIFASTGAEGIEAAMKHAELDRVLRIADALAEIEQHIDGALARFGDDIEVTETVARIRRVNAELAARPPLFAALEGGFHGKLVGSLQLTHNPGVRTPFGALAAQARFVSPDRSGSLKPLVDEAASARLLDLVVEDGLVRTVERPFPLFCAFFLEPIQGEGGITPLTSEFVEEIQEACAEIGCPVIVDEIQSGMGRTGDFLAGTAVGLRGDYYVIGKGLGGGIGKCAALLVRQSRYRPQFELLHSSTFAKDGFSSGIALKTLELLEADDGHVYRRAAELGERLLSVMRALRDDFPGVVKDVRGRGLMLGLDFHDQSGAAAPSIGAASASGFFGYFLSGFLLREHAMRVFPTASAVNTLRFEPSIGLTADHVDRLETALRDLCTVLRDQEDGRFAPSPTSSGTA